MLQPIIDSLLISDPMPVRSSTTVEWPYVDADRNPLRELENPGVINIFVGANNSGKSRLLRYIASRTSLRFAVGRTELAQLAKTLAQSVERLSAEWARYRGLESIGGLSPDKLAVLPIPTHLSAESDLLKAIKSNVQQLRAIGEGRVTTSSGTLNHTSPDPHLRALMLELAGSLEDALQAIDRLDVGSLSPADMVYIPALRGLRALQTHDGGEADLYRIRTQTDYFSQNDIPRAPRVFTGLTLYAEVTDQLLGDRQKRERLRAYENFLSERLFEGVAVSLIPRRDSDVLFVKLGSETEQPIHHLGDGIQTVIILTYLAFVLDRAWFFVEEPELYLHPGFQRKLVEVLLEFEGRHRFFLTTHSNHFLDMTMDYRGIATYGFRKMLDHDDGDEITPRFIVEQLDTADQTALSLLGVRNSSVFLVNATVWVEGITDRFYLRTILQLYASCCGQGSMSIAEDLHYSFVEYGGANVVHYTFVDGYEESPINVQRLCSKAVVVVDGDGGNKEARIAALREKLNDRLVVLPVREIENLLPWSVIRQVVASYEGVDPQSIPDCAPDSYSQEYLGDYIEKVLGKEMMRRGGYAASSGTLKDKRAFCERALRFMQEPSLLDDLALPVIDLVRGIHEFIVAQNKA